MMRKLRACCQETFTVFLLLVICESVSSKDTIYIGVIERTNSDEGIVVNLALDFVSRNRLLPDDVSLKAYSRPLEVSSSGLDYILTVESLIADNVTAIVGPIGSSAVKNTHPICSGLHVPQVTAGATDSKLSFTSADYRYLIKMSTPDVFQTRALLDVAVHFRWKRFCLLADDNDYGRNGVSEFVAHASSSEYNLEVTSVHFLSVTEKLTREVILPILTKIHNSGVRIIIVNSAARRTRRVMDIAKDYKGMTSAGWAWLVTDGTTSLGQGALLRGTEGSTPDHLWGLIGTRPAVSKGDLYPNFTADWALYTDGAPVPEPYTIRVFDAILAVAYGIRDLYNDGYTLSRPAFGRLELETKHDPFTDGSTLIKYISQINAPGVMSQLRFTELLYPFHVRYEVVNLQDGAWLTVGDWYDRREENQLELDKSELIFPGGASKVPTDTDFSDISTLKLNLTVVSILTTPFLDIKQETACQQDTRGFGCYKGYIIDLIAMLNESVGGFTHPESFYVVTDNLFGDYNETTHSWNGIVGDLVSGKADVAIAPLTITADREMYIEFSKPFMDLGLLLYMAKQKESEDNILFLQPFSLDLWMSFLAAYLIISVATTVFTYVSPYDWGGRGIEAESKGKPAGIAMHFFRPVESFWYCLVIAMHQGTMGITPRSASGRIVFGTWFFAVTILSATYTAYFASILTVKNLEKGITSVWDLQKQSQIKYGTVKASSVDRFFRTQEQMMGHYAALYETMSFPENQVESLQMGLKRVRDSYGKPKREQYAFIFDSSPLEHDASLPPCQTETVGRIFHPLGYGIAFQRNSDYTELLSQHVLLLRDSGKLDKLYDKWFKSNSTSCENHAETNKYQQATVQGMKTVLKASALGMMTAIIVLILEWFLAIHLDTRRDKRTLKRKPDYSKSYVDLVCRNFRRRGRNLFRFLQKSLGMESQTQAGIDVNIQNVEEEEKLNVK